MVGTVLKDDLGDFVADQFGQWVDNLHKSDPPLPPIEIPNPLEAVAPAAQQMGNALPIPGQEQIANALAMPGQAVEGARSAFLDWTDSLNSTRESNLAAPPVEDYQRVGNLPPSDFMQWTQQVESGLPPPSAPVTAPSVAPAGGTAAPALPHSEEPATATDQVQTAAPNAASRWKTQFDFGATYTGSYRTGTPHRGVDLVPSSGGGIGTPVEAFYPGTVSNIFRDSGAGGLVVYVQDADGLTHAYMHLQDVAPGLQVGQRVDRGTPLARMGESGTEGSPHLHYEVRKNAANGDPLNQLIDPRPYMRGGAVGANAPQGVSPTSAVPTTAGISGGGARAGGVGERGQQILAGAADVASWLGDQGQKALQAVLITEGGLNNARGDQGHSAGPLQFYGGPKGGQLNNFARAMGLGLEEAKAYVEQHPLEAVQWAIGTPSNPGYLGRAIADGLARNLSGAELATYAQRTGQVSESPERAGQNYNALFGGGQDALAGGVRAATGVVTDVLGPSQRLVASTAENVGTAASTARQDASSALTDWMLERRDQGAAALEGFRAPVTAVGDVLGQIGELPGLSEADRTARRQMLEQSPLGQVREQIANAPVLGGALDIARKQTWLVEDRELLEEATPQQIETARNYASLTNPNPTDQDIANVLRGFRAGENAAMAGTPGGPASAAGKVVPPANWGDKAVTVGVNNLLGNPAGMLSNALSGVGENLYRPLNTAIVRRELGPAFNDLRAQGGAIGDALADAWHTFRSGERRSGLDTPDYPEAFPGWSGTLPFTSGNLRFNTAMDEFNRKLADVGGQAAELARRQRANPGLDEFGLLDRFRQDIADAGASAQKSATFESGGTGFGEDIAAARRKLTDPNASPRDRAKGLLATILVPFSKIPDAILTRGVLGMPVVAETRAAINVAKALRSGDSAAVQTALHQWVLTEAVNAAIGWQVVQGNITGAGPDDPSKKSALMNARDENGDPIWQPNSLKVPTPWGARFIPYSSLGPIAGRLGLIANAVEQYKLAEGKVDPDYVTATGKALGETITDAWYLQNIGRAFQAIKNGKIFDAAGETLLDFGERHIPDAALANQLRQMMDPVVREPSEEQPRGALEDIANRIPGLSQFVAPKLDPATGQPITRPKDIGSLLLRSPAPGQPNPVNEALARHNLGVPDAPNTVTRGSATLELTDDEKRRYLELAGPEVGRRVESVIGGTSYDNLPLDQQRRRLEGAVRTGRDAGEAKLWASIPLEERNRRVREYREAQKRQAEPSVRLP
jgi:murein DD-endopeptidase MepM/ murein hydrolase activator NlpD